MNDVLAHYHMFDYRARAALAVTTETVREAARRHNLDPITTIAVGRAITCAALLASTLKDAAEYVHLSFGGTGLVQKVVGECNGDGHCRGYTSPQRIETVMPQGAKVPETVGEALGHKGTLVVTRGRLGSTSPYNAMIELTNGEIATDIAAFLTDSEQIPSAVAAGVKLSPTGDVLAAGGVLVQRLGGAALSEATLTDLERRIAQGLHISDRIERQESLDEIVAFLQAGPTGFGSLMERPLAFQCACTRERMANALFALGETELKEIHKETGKIETRCQYCASTHAFKLEELVSH